MNLDFIFNFTSIEIYILVAVLMLINGLFLFPSSQLILVFSGVIGLIKEMNLVILFCILVLFNVLGNYLLYLISYNYGEKVARKFLPMRKKKLDENILIIKYLFKKHGKLVILIARNLPILHSLVSLPAGVAKISEKFFLLYTIIGVCTWSLIFFIMGISLGNNYENFFGFFNSILIIFAAIITVVIFYYFVKYKKSILLDAKEDLI